MSRVGFGLLNRFASHIVKAKDPVRIAGKALRRGDIFDPVLFPQSTFVAERANAAFRAHARACKNDNVANKVHQSHEARAVSKGQAMIRAGIEGGIGIGIIGSAGRMGKAIAQAAPGAGFVISGAIDAGGDPIALAQVCDVLIDFSSPKALVANLGAAVAAAKPIIVGTTGLEEHHHQAIDDAARHVAVLQTGNTSLGVTLLAELVRLAAARLGPDWDIEIAELHHRHKVDAPSGTALLLGKAAADGRGVSLEQAKVSGRDGVTGAREEGSIGFAALRGGSAAGDHLVLFAGDQERIELTHRAESRAIFASGALKAAKWIIGQPAGRYDMRQVLGL